MQTRTLTLRQNVQPLRVLLQGRVPLVGHYGTNANEAEQHRALYRSAETTKENPKYEICELKTYIIYQKNITKYTMLFNRRGKGMPDCIFVYAEHKVFSNAHTAPSI